MKGFSAAISTQSSTKLLSFTPQTYRCILSVLHTYHLLCLISEPCNTLDALLDVCDSVPRLDQAHYLCVTFVPDAAQVLHDRFFNL